MAFRENVRRVVACASCGKELDPGSASISAKSGDPLCKGCESHELVDARRPVPGDGIAYAAITLSLFGVGLYFLPLTVSHHRVGLPLMAFCCVTTLGLGVRARTDLVSGATRASEIAKRALPRTLASSAILIASAALGLLVLALFAAKRPFVPWE
jgi:hypothetical protein